LLSSDDARPSQRPNLPFPLLAVRALSMALFHLMVTLGCRVGRATWCVHPWQVALTVESVGLRVWWCRACTLRAGQGQGPEAKICQQSDTTPTIARHGLAFSIDSAVATPALPIVWYTPCTSMQLSLGDCCSVPLHWPWPLLLLCIYSAPVVAEK